MSNLAASHPSVKGQRPQERWIGATGNHRRPTRCPEPSFRLRSALPVTGVLAARPGSQESNVYGAGQTRTRLLGRQTFRSQSASEWATSTSRQN